MKSQMEAEALIQSGSPRSGYLGIDENHQNVIPDSPIGKAKAGLICVPPQNRACRGGVAQRRYIGISSQVARESRLNRSTRLLHGGPRLGLGEHDDGPVKPREVVLSTGDRTAGTEASADPEADRSFNQTARSLGKIDDRSS